MQNLKGQAISKFTFASTAEENSFSAISTKGNVVAISSRFDVDFANGAVTDGNLGVYVDDPLNANDHRWSLNFAGKLDGGRLNIADFSNSKIEYINPVTADVMNETMISPNSTFGGVFTGFSAQGFLGAFDLIDQSNAENSVQGVFSTGRSELVAPTIPDN